LSALLLWVALASLLGEEVPARAATIGDVLVSYSADGAPSHASRLTRQATEMPGRQNQRTRFEGATLVGGIVSDLHVRQDIRPVLSRVATH
jgi:hypothetical protein